MPFTTAGGSFMANALTAVGAPVLFDAGHAYLGVGDSSTAFNAAQTDLVAATNKLRKAMDATYPTVAANVITLRSTFGTGEANFAWNEAGVFNDPSAGTMLTRKVVSLGTKPNTESWQLTTTITITVA